MQHKRLMMHGLNCSSDCNQLTNGRFPFWLARLSLGSKRGKQDTFHRIAVAIVPPALPLTTS
jgi:hypothetical protein